MQEEIWSTMTQDKPVRHCGGEGTAGWRMHLVVTILRAMHFRQFVNV